MDRVFESGASATPPSAPSSPSSGYARAGNPATSTAATKPGPWWYHMMTEEMRAVLVAAGLTPDHTNTTQLAQAIGVLTSNASKAVVISGVTFNAGVANGQPVYWDSANSRFDKALADGTVKQNCVGFADVTNSKLYAFGDATLWSATLTAGSRYFLSNSTAGAVTTTQPSSNVVQLGVAKTASQMFVDIDQAPNALAQVSAIGSRSGLKISATGASPSITITADEVVLRDSSNAYLVARSVNLTLNTATSGANGLDTGTLATNTIYHEFVISNGTTTAALASLSSTAPIMPSGYTYRARVGAFLTDGTGNKYPLGFTQIGDLFQFKVGSANVSAAPLLATGAQGSIATPTFVAADWTAYAPATIAALNIMAGTSTGSVLIAPNASHAAVVVPLRANLSGQAMIVPESNNIYYACDSGNGRAYLLGWRDNV